MERTVQVLAVHCVKAMLAHCGQPGHHARTCPLNREQQRQHILTRASEKAAPE